MPAIENAISQRCRGINLLEFVGLAVMRAHSSAVERPAHNRLVPGSNPGGPTKPQTSSAYCWQQDSMLRHPTESSCLTLA